LPNDEAMSTVLQPCTSSLAPSPTSMVSCEDIFLELLKSHLIFFSKKNKKNVE